MGGPPIYNLNLPAGMLQVNGNGNGNGKGPAAAAPGQDCVFVGKFKCGGCCVSSDVRAGRRWASGVLCGVAVLAGPGALYGCNH